MKQEDINSQPSTMQCPHCLSLSIVEDEGTSICESCGFVLFDQPFFRSEVELETVGQRTRPSGTILSNFDTSFTPSAYGRERGIYLNSNTAKNTGMLQCSRIANLLHLSKTFESQIIHLASLAMGGKWKQGRKAELMIASCAYIVARQNMKPITLLDVSDAVQCNVFELGRVFNQVNATLKISLGDLDPALYIERCLSHLSLSDSLQREIAAQALRFVNIAKDDWLVTGRRPGAITAAAIMLALEWKGLLPEALNDVASSLNISPQTVKLRVRELKDTFVLIGQQLLPWGQDISRKNVMDHLGDILKQLEFVQKVQKSKKEGEGVGSSGANDVEVLSSFDPEKPKKPLLGSLPPPSFYKNEKSKQRRRVKVERAKNRLISLIGNNPVVFDSLDHLKIKSEEPSLLPQSSDEDLDEEDLTIEKLLLQGKQEDQIIDGDLSPPSSFAKNLIHLDDVLLNESDIPEEELSLFIRSPSETAFLESLQREVQRPTKRLRV